MQPSKETKFKISHIRKDILFLKYILTPTPVKHTHKGCNNVPKSLRDHSSR